MNPSTTPSATPAAASANNAAPTAAPATAGQQQQQLPGPGAPGSNYSSASLYVGELHLDATETMLFDVFRTVGPIASMRVCRDAVTRRSLGYAYVNFHNPEDAERALDTLNYTAIRGKPCRIMWSHRDPSLRRSGQGNVFIKNLDKLIDNKALFDTFSVFGNILSCKVATDEHSQSKGYGFVHYETQEAADQAIAKVNNMLLNGKIVTVCKFLAKRDRAQNGVDFSKFTNIYVKNLDLSTKGDDLKKLFSRFGQINSCVIMNDTESKSKGFGFINFEKPESAKQAVEEMNGQMVDGKVIFVGRAQKKSEREAELKAKFEQLKLERMAKEAGVNLYIKNLDDSYDDEKLRAEFTPFGQITSAKVMRDDKNISKGFGFVCFTTPEEATKAITDMNGKMLANKPIYVALAQRKDVRRAQLESYHRAQQNFARAGFPSNVYAPMGPVYYPPPQGAGMGPRGGQPGFVAYPPQQMIPRGRWTAPQGQMPRQGGAAGYNYVMPVNQRQRGGRQQGRGGPQQGGVPRAQQAGVAAGGAPAGVPAAGAAGGAPMVDANRSFKWTKDARNKDAAEPATAPAAGADAAAASTPEDRKQMLGESLFPLVYAAQPKEAGKITGMLLELGVPEVLELLENPVALSGKIQEAMAVLKASGERALALCASPPPRRLPRPSLT